MPDDSPSNFEQAITIVQSGISRTVDALRACSESAQISDPDNREGLALIADTLDGLTVVSVTDREQVRAIRPRLDGAVQILSIVGDRTGLWAAKTALDAYDTMWNVLDIKATLPGWAGPPADTLLLESVQMAAQYHPLDKYVETTGSAQLEASTRLVAGLKEQLQQRQADLSRQLVTLDCIRDLNGTDTTSLHSNEASRQMDTFSDYVGTMRPGDYPQRLASSIAPGNRAQSYVWAEEALAQEIEATEDNDFLSSLQSKVRVAARRGQRNEILNEAKSERLDLRGCDDLADLLHDYHSDEWNPIGSSLATVGRLLSRTDPTDWAKHNHLEIGKRFRDLLYDSWSTIDQQVAELERTF